MDARARFAVGLASTGHLMCHGGQLFLNQVQGEAATHFGVALPEISIAISAFWLGMGLTSVPGGLWADRVGTGRVLVAYFACLASAALLCGLAPTYHAFLAAHFLLGGAAGLFHPAGLGLISHAVPRASLGPALGWHGVAGSVGAALAPLVVLGAHERWGFQGAFLGLSVAATASAGAGVWLLRTGRIPARRPGVAGVVADATPHRTIHLWALGALLAAMSINGFLSNGFLTLFPETLKRGGAVWLSPRWELMLVLALGGVGQFVGGTVSRGGREGRRYLAMLVIQPVLLGVIAAVLVGGGASARPALALSLLSSFAFMNYMTQPIENHLLAGFTSTARRAVAYGMKFLAGLLVGAPAAWIVREIEQGWDEATAYRALGGVALLGVAAGAAFLIATRGPAAPSRAGGASAAR